MLTQDFTALRQRFLDAFNEDVEVFYDNAPNRDRPLAPYIHFSVKPSDSKPYTFDGKMQIGRVWAQVFVPKGTGEVDAYRLLDAFAAVYRGWSSLDGAISCQTESINGPFDDPNGMMMYSVSVPWTSYREYP